MNLFTSYTEEIYLNKLFEMSKIILFITYYDIRKNVTLSLTNKCSRICILEEFLHNFLHTKIMKGKKSNLITYFIQKKKLMTHKSTM